MVILAVSMAMVLFNSEILRGWILLVFGRNRTNSLAADAFRGMPIAGSYSDLHTSYPTGSCRTRHIPVTDRRKRKNTQETLPTVH